MVVKLMTTAVCWDMDANVSASFAHAAPKDLFYFCPCCLEEVVAAISILGNFYFRALNSHKPRCVNEKAPSHASAFPGVSAPRPAYIAPPLIPSHLGKLSTRRKNAKPTVTEMQALASSLQASTSAVIHPGTLAEVVEAWSAMTVNVRQRTSLSIAGQQLTYFDAFAQLTAAQKNIASLGCDRLITHAQATVSLLDNVVLVVTWLKFDTQNKPVPIRVKMKRSDPVANQLAKGQHVRLFLHGPAPVLNAQQKYFEMQNISEYLGFIVMT